MDEAMSCKKKVKVSDTVDFGEMKITRDRDIV